MVIHAVARIQRHLDGHGSSFHINDLKAAPALLRKHDLLLEFVHKGLDIGALLLVGNQDALGRRGNDHIVQPHGQHRHIHLIDDMHARALVVQFSLADDVLIHRLGKGIPGAQVLPHTGIAHHLNFGLVLHHRIVERNLFQGIVFIEQVLIIGKIHEFVGLVHHIAQLIGKHTTVPQGPLGNVACSHVCRGLFFEGLDTGHMVPAFRDDIAVLLAGIGGLNAHKHQIGLSPICLGGQLLQSLKIAVLHVRVYRANHHRLLWRNVQHIHQIGRGQCNGREGVPAAGLHADAHILPQLIVDGGDLGLAGSNGHRGIRIHLFDLPVDPLDHGLIAAVLFFEELNKLFGTDVVGQGPKTFSGSAGEQNNIHKLSLSVRPAWGCSENPHRQAGCRLPVPSCRSSQEP